MTRDIFDKERLPPEIDEFVRGTNPWWEGKPGPRQPEYRRWAFRTTIKKLEKGLAPAVVLRGRARSARPRCSSRASSS